MTTSMRSRMWPVAVLLLCLTLAACGGGSGGGGGGGGGSDGGDDVVDTLPSGDLYLSLLAGDVGGPGHQDGDLEEARFWGPTGLAYDSTGNLYVAEGSNGAVRKVTPGGTVSTVASGFSWIEGLAVDADDVLWFTDMVEGKLFRLPPGGPLEEYYATSGAPGGIAFGTDYTMYLADGLRGVVYAFDGDGAATVFVGGLDASDTTDGTGTAARFRWPIGLAMNAAGDTLYVIDRDANTIRAVTVPGGVVTTLAGFADFQGDADGTGSAARFRAPRGAVVDGDGNLIVADTDNNTLRKVTPAGEVTTLAGAPGTCGSDDGTGTDARFCGPGNVTLDPDGAVLVSDTSNSLLRIMDASAAVSTAAGSVPQTGTVDDSGTNAAFTNPRAIAADGAGTLYVAEPSNTQATIMGQFRKITPAGDVTTLANPSPSIGGIAVGGGVLYVTVPGTQVIASWTEAGGFTIVAGQEGNDSAVDGDALTTATFTTPQGVARDGAGNLYVADSGNCLVRKITPGGVVSTLAGNRANLCAGSPADGTGTAAYFANLQGMAIDAAGNLYVVDGQAIRKITPGGVVTTLAGDLGGERGSADGTGTAARFDDPQGVAVDGAGNVYVADTDNHAIRRITPAGVVTTLVGTVGYSGFQSGALPGLLRKPYGVAYRGGQLYITTAQGVAVVNDVVPPSGT